MDNSASFCKDCGTKTNEELINAKPDPKPEEDALSIIESLKVMCRFYVYPENRKWLTTHILLSIVTAGAWLLYLLVVWFSIWDGSTSKDIEEFRD